MGVIAPWDIEVELTGDASLCKRPMRRIANPLSLMGASFMPEGKETLPLIEKGTTALKAISYDSPIASAQLKTAVILAGLRADGQTTVTEPAPSRNHTELMLPEYGAEATSSDCVATVVGPCVLKASSVVVPGDPSSAAFPVCAALLHKGSSIDVENVSLNEARIGFVRTLERMGANISLIETGREGKEPAGTIRVSFTDSLHACQVEAREIASQIDEIPVLSLVAATAEGVTVFKDISELRVKESDRAQAIIDGLALLGINAWIDGDDLLIEGKPGLTTPEGLVFDSLKDHRLAMTWSLAGMCLGNSVSIIDFESVNISYPGFLSTFER